MSITLKTIEHIAALSRLELTDGEKEREARDLGKILEYMDKLNELDTSHVETTTRASNAANVFRPDEVRPSHDRDGLLANAPDVCDGCYRVPKTVE